jgi:hypothetical protein
MEQQLISKEISDFARAFLGGTQQGFYKVYFALANVMKWLKVE